MCYPYSNRLIRLEVLLTNRRVILPSLPNPDYTVVSLPSPTYCMPTAYCLLPQGQALCKVEGIQYSTHLPYLSHPTQLNMLIT